MRITQGTFSYLPDLTDDQIRLQVQYCLSNGWPAAGNCPCCAWSGWSASPVMV